MAIVIFAFVICSGFMAFDAFDSGWTVALSIFGSSVLSVLAGSGLRGSLYSGIGPIVGGLVMACIFMGIAQWLGTMYSVGLFENQLSGHVWSVIGFVVSFLCTSKKFSGEVETF
jgi:hypothetical protein